MKRQVQRNKNAPSESISTHCFIWLQCLFIAINIFFTVKTSFFRTIKFAHTVYSLENPQSWWALMFAKSPNLKPAICQQIWKKPLVPVVQQENKEQNKWWNPKTLMPNWNFLLMDHKYEKTLAKYIYDSLYSFSSYWIKNALFSCCTKIS